MFTSGGSHGTSSFLIINVYSASVPASDFTCIFIVFISSSSVISFCPFSFAYAVPSMLTSLSISFKVTFTVDISVHPFTVTSYVIFAPSNSFACTSSIVPSSSFELAVISLIEISSVSGLSTFLFIWNCLPVTMSVIVIVAVPSDNAVS